MDNSRIRTILVGLSPSAQPFVDAIFPAESTRSFPYDMEVLTALPEDLRPICVVCGATPPEVSDIEVAQLFRSLYIDAAIFLVTEIRQDFDRKIFKKNGFTDAFLLPIDEGEFATSAKRILARVGETQSFRAVKLIDLTEDTVLEFRTYVHLPLNDKYVCFSNSGRPMPKERLDRLKSREVGTMMVSEQDMPRFYSYTADCLRKLGASDKISATEKRERMEGAVRDLMGGLFNEASQGNHLGKGRELVNDCQQIVRSYIVDGNKKNEWFDKILALGSQETGTYAHLSNVATFASLFSMGLGVGNPEDLAMAGLLHDVGMIQVPREIQLKDEASLTPEEKAILHRHPLASIEVIKNWRMNVPESVVRAIAQHHERIDGSGYPEALLADKISKEAQVLAIADEFDLLISGQNGPRLTPAAALYHIIDTNMADPLRSKFDQDILMSLKKVIPLPKAS